MGTARSLLQTIKWAAVGISSAVISKFDKEKGKNFLLDSFREMPGVPAKFSQILEMRWHRDIELPSSVHEGKLPDELHNLLSIEEVKFIIQRDMPVLFNEIDEIDSLGKSASLGQVHWAKMKSGEIVAIKVQYPNLDSDLISQLDSMLYLMEKSPAKNFGLTVSDYRKSMNEYIGRELDYKLEATMQKRFRDMFAELSNLAIPKVYPVWSGSRILTQEYIAAEVFGNLTELHEKTREEIARTIVEFWLTGVFQSHFIHTDLQPRNWGYNDKIDKVVLYDFGSWIEITPEHSLLLEAIIEGILERKNISPLDYLVALGFDGEKLLPLLNRLPLLLEKLLDPFLASGWWYANQWNLSAQLDEMLGNEAWWFRTAGPPWFLWFMRSAQGVFGALNSLKVGVPFQSIFYDVLNRLSRDRFTKLAVPSQIELLRKHQRDEVLFKHEARQFCVKVLENDDDVVSLEFPVHVVQELEMLVSDDVRLKIESQGYDLKEIKARIVKEGLLKGVVLDTKIGKRRYLLYLQ
jgi:predicted unusual protein kinase regulating ubiquinone biosynthesis (AarF/ABC1/UbiB family)